MKDRPTSWIWLAVASICTVQLGQSLSSHAQDDVADVPSQRRQVGDDANKSYFLIPPADEKAPADGFGLLVILPVGDGSAEVHPFIKRIRKHAVPADFAVAQPISVKWAEDQVVVWPTEKLSVEQQEFSTETLVEEVIKDAATVHKIDPARVYCLGWSSSGPAVYALARKEKSPVKGSYIAMSVYKPKLLPPLKNAKGRSIYIEHSPDDRVCPYWMARKGHADLKDAGARVTLATYEGGHGWRGDIYGRIKTALAWLEEGVSDEGNSP